MAAAALLVAPMAQAGTIVNTGPGDDPEFGGYALNVNQWLAGKFILGGASTITGVEGWIGGEQSVILTAAIYSDSGSLPASLIYSGDFTSGEGGWQGVTGQSWALGAGDYWAVFQTTHVAAGDGNWMPGYVVSPLVHYARIRQTEWTWDEVQVSYGFRISGIRDVPEPATWALMILGFGAIGSALRRERTRRDRLA